MIRCIKVLQDGIKPTLHFTCHLCGAQWLDGWYEVKERPWSPVIFASVQAGKQPVSDCPTCNMASYDYKKAQEQLMTEADPE